MQRLPFLLIGCLFLGAVVLANQTEVAKLIDSVKHQQQSAPTSVTNGPKIIQSTRKTPKPTPVVLTQISVDQVRAAINLFRVSKKIPTLKLGTTTCGRFDQIIFDSGFDAIKIQALCPNCEQVIYANMSSDSQEDQVAGKLLSDATASGILTNKVLRYLCITEKNSWVHLLGFSSPMTVTPTTTKVIQPAPKNFSEIELWKSLVDYRQSHKLPDLIREEQICTYARKRVQDHLNWRKENKSAADYPVPGKYPLDGHDGFKKDADSNLSFSMAGKNELAENLAYWPNAANSTQVIEWGWDTSTEGHKETQLTTYYTHGCLSGRDGFFVAIFGK